MAEFIQVLEGGGFRIDLSEAQKSGKLRLVKKAGFEQKGRPSLELAKRYGLFPDRQELSGPDGKPIPVGISFEEALREWKGAVDPSEPVDSSDKGNIAGLALGLWARVSATPVR